MYRLVSPNFSAALTILQTVQAGNKDQVALWVEDITKKYQAIKSSHKDPKPMPANLYK